MCIEGSDYRVSIAKRATAFNAKTDVKLNFVEEFGGPESVSPCNFDRDLNQVGSPFVEAFKTPSGPPENPEWIVHVFTVPQSNLTCPSTIGAGVTVGGFTVELLDPADPTKKLAIFSDVKPATCVFPTL